MEVLVGEKGCGGVRGLGAWVLVGESVFQRISRRKLLPKRTHRVIIGP